jgi:hypothetical protein
LHVIQCHRTERVKFSLNIFLYSISARNAQGIWLCPLVDFLSRKFNLSWKFFLPLDCEKSSANDQQNLFESVCVSSSNTTTSSTDLSDYNNTSTSGNTATTNTNSSSNNNSSNNSNQLNGQDSFPAAPAASGGGEYTKSISIRTFNCSGLSFLLLFHVRLRKLFKFSRIRSMAIVRTWMKHLIEFAMWHHTAS